MSSIASTIDLVKSDKIIRLEAQLAEFRLQLRKFRAENARLKRELAKLQSKGEK